MSLRIFLNRELLLLAIFFLVLLIVLLLLALEILGATQAALLDIGRGIVVNEADDNEEEEIDGTLECFTMLDVSTLTPSLFLCCRLTPSCNGGIVVEY